MPKFLIASMLASTFAACSTTQPATPEPSPGPALWTLSDADTTIHLFGFAPVLKAGTDWETNTITDALNASDMLIIESDNGSPDAQAAIQVLIGQLGLNPDDTTLSSKLSEGDRAEINTISSGLGAPLAALDALKPWLASVQLGVMSISQDDYDVTNPPSVQLLASAKAVGKETRALEAPTDLMRLMAGLSEPEQLGMLLHTARMLRDKPTQQMDIAKAWLAGDVETIAHLLHGNHGAWSSPAIYNAMLVMRNQQWLEEIKTLMDEYDGTVFLTVGLGHLAGDDSLINMLKRSNINAVRQ